MNRVERSWSRPLFGIVLISFLLPFVTVTCAGQPMVTMSGVQLVVGAEATIDDPFGGFGPGPTESNRIDPEPWAIVAALVALGGLVVGAGRLSVALGAAGVVSLLLLRASISADAAGAEALGFGISYQVGYWLALAGFGGAGVLNLMVVQDEARSVATRPARSPPAHVDAAAPSVPVPAPSGGMCGGCGAAVPPAARFCPACGTAQPPSGVSG